MSVTDTGEDRSRKIFQEIDKLQQLSVFVGVQGQADSEVVEYAIFNEFGTSTIPARPFLRLATDQGQERLADRFQEDYGQLLDGKLTAKQVMARVGILGVELVRQQIRNSPGWAEPNAPSTIEKKGSSTPLIDSGRLIQSITYEVRKGEQVVESGTA